MKERKDTHYLILGKQTCTEQK